MEIIGQGEGDQGKREEREVRGHEGERKWRSEDRESERRGR